MDFIKKVRKFLFKRFWLSRANRTYIATPSPKVVLAPTKTNFLLVSLAFNDLRLIKLQKESLKKLTDAYDHVVADNSSDPEQATAVESFCAQEGIGYARVPQPNPGLDRSLSHGFSLNWIFYNIVKKINPEKFGFLESDVLVETSGSFLTPWRGKDFWGMKAPPSPQSTVWRLWPGFCFFSRDFYSRAPLNFLPCKNIDTGGMNFKILDALDTTHLIPLVPDIILPGSNARVQRFANVVHLGEMSSRAVGQQAIDAKWEFALQISSSHE